MESLVDCRFTTSWHHPPQKTCCETLFSLEQHVKQSRIPSISCRWTPVPLHTRHLDHVVPSRAPVPLQSIHTWAVHLWDRWSHNSWWEASKLTKHFSEFQCWMTWIYRQNLAWNQNHDQFKWVGSDWVVVGFLPIWWEATFAKPTYQVGKKRKLPWTYKSSPSSCLWICNPFTTRLVARPPCK